MIPLRNTSPPFNAAQHNHGYLKHEYVSQEGQVFSCPLNWLLPHPSQPVIQREERPREREWWQPFRRSHFRRQQKYYSYPCLGCSAHGGEGSKAGGSLHRERYRGPGQVLTLLSREAPHSSR